MSVIAFGPVLKNTDKYLAVTQKAHEEPICGKKNLQDGSLAINKRHNLMPIFHYCMTTCAARCAGAPLCPNTAKSGPRFTFPHPVTHLARDARCVIACLYGDI